MSYIEKLFNGEKLKNFSISELNILCGEIREFIIEKVSKNGGHLASNLGVVELTVALHYVFDMPTDKLIWDVGHQAYIHKILSGRINEFNNLRQLGGISGFPKSEESEYDVFNTGHATTSISAGIGYARARDILGENHKIISVIGDGSLGGGMAYEALNDADELKSQMLIIINDNEMSISKNVGAMSSHLSSIRTSGRYFRVKQWVVSKLEKREMVKTIRFIRNIKDVVRNALTENTVFKGLGITYFGPFDGHDLSRLIRILNRVKNINKPVIMHVRTVKGKGYLPAENMPDVYHGVSAGNMENKTQKTDFSAVFGSTLTEIAENNKNVVAITAAMPDGTGLNEFKNKFPKRYFNVGIAEAHAVTLAAGMAKGGLVPVVPIYSSFMQRAFDSILHDICLQNLHVVLCADRSGIVGADGETHHGIYDISYSSLMPGLTVLAPADFISLKEMLKYAVNEAKGPVLIRYPRGAENPGIPHFSSFEVSKGEVLQTGKDVCIFACGNMVNTALLVSEKLRNRGLFAQVVNISTIKPIDVDLIINESKKYDLVFTIEDNVKNGGMGEQIASIIANHGIHTRVIIKAYQSGKIPHGTVSELMCLENMDAGFITEEIISYKGKL